MYKSKRIDSSPYAYATGRIRALETRLVSAGRLGRFLEARSVEDIGRLLVENGYPAASDPEQSLNLELTATYELIHKLSPDPQLVDTLMLARDFHNLRVMLKALSVYWPRREASPVREALVIEQIYEGGGHPQAENVPEQAAPAESDLWPMIHGPVTWEQVMPMVQIPSTVDPQSLFHSLRERKPSDMPPLLARTAAQAAARYQQTYDISEIDILIDKALARSMSDAAETVGVPFFTGFIRLRIDLINLGMLLRTRFLKSGEEYLKRILLPGGGWKPAEIAALYGESASVLTEALNRQGLVSVAEAAEHFADGGDAIARFSQASDDHLIRYVQRGKQVLRGPEVLMGYLIAREMEIKTIRVILTCLRNHIPVEKARDLARLAYL